MKDRTPSLPWTTARDAAITVGRATQCKQRVYKDQVGWTWGDATYIYPHHPHVFADTIAVPHNPVDPPHPNTQIGGTK